MSLLNSAEVAATVTGLAHSMAWLPPCCFGCVTVLLYVLSWLTPLLLPLLCDTLSCVGAGGAAVA